MNSRHWHGLSETEVGGCEYDQNGKPRAGAGLNGASADANNALPKMAGLTDEQVEQILIDSYKNAEDDLRLKQLINEKVEAEGIMNALHEAIQRDRDLLADSVRKDIDKALSDLHKKLVKVGQENLAPLWIRLDKRVGLLGGEQYMKDRK